MQRTNDTSSKERPYVILGGGGHARVVASTLYQLNKSILGFTDPNRSSSVGLDIEHLGGDEILSEYTPDDVFLVNGMGSAQDTASRMNLFLEQKGNGFHFPVVVHRKAILAPDAKLGIGAQVMAGAVVQTGTTVAENVIVNTSASIDHDCYIASHTHIAPGVTLSGGVTIGEGVHIGTGASVIHEVNIGAQSVVGAGAVVVEDVPPKTTVVGVPAQPK